MQTLEPDLAKYRIHHDQQTNSCAPLVFILYASRTQISNAGESYWGSARAVAPS